MPGLTSQQFIAALRNGPAGFLRSTLVFFDHGQGMSPHGWATSTQAATFTGNVQAGVHRPMRFTITHEEGFHVEYPGRLRGSNDDGNFYWIRPDGAGTQYAYFLPWRMDSGYSIVIGNSADLFVNAMMDGCSFGWTPGPNGIIRLVHHNIQGNNGQTSNAMMMQSLGICRNRFMRDDYRNLGGQGEGTCSIIGVRSAQGWRIYAELISGGYGRFRIEGVRRLQ